MTLTVSGNTIAAVDVTVRQPNGTSSAACSSPARAAFRDMFTLPVTGTYTITIDPRDQNTGPLTFTLEPGARQHRHDVDRHADDGHDRHDRRERRPHLHGDGRPEDDAVGVGEHDPGVDVTVRQPNGTFVGSLFVSGPSAFRDVMTLPVTGTYTITIDPRDQNTGTLTFTLEPRARQHRGRPRSARRPTVTIGTIGENAVRTFAATAGQKMTLTVAGNTIPGVDLTIRQPNGTFVGGLFVSGPTGFRDAMTLPVTGTYTITIDPATRTRAAHVHAHGRDERHRAHSRRARLAGVPGSARGVGAGSRDLPPPRPRRAAGPDAHGRRGARQRSAGARRTSPTRR